MIERDISIIFFFFWGGEGVKHTLTYPAYFQREDLQPQSLPPWLWSEKKSLQIRRNVLRIGSTRTCYNRRREVDICMRRGVRSIDVLLPLPVATYRRPRERRTHRTTIIGLHTQTDHPGRQVSKSAVFIRGGDCNSHDPSAVPD